MKREVLKRLAEGLATLDAEIRICNRCGSCQSFCPLYSATKKEGDTSRGKFAILSAVMDDMLEDPATARRALDRCLLCGACSRQCPRGANPADVFLRARQILTEIQGLPMAVRLVLKEIVSHPERMDRILDLAGKRFQGGLPDISALPDGLRRRLPLLPETAGLSISRTPMRRRLAPKKTGGPKVLLFLGCVSDRVLTDTAESALRLLEAAGFEVMVPEEQGCCGMPSYSTGDLAGARRLARWHGERWNAEDFDHLVTPCATCTAMIRKHWPELSPRTEAVAEKGIEILDLVAERLSEDLFRTDLPEEVVTWHDPCHLDREGESRQTPRRLLEKIPGIRFAEMEAADRCCGASGSFRLKDPASSAKVGDFKRDAAAAVGAHLIATACPACRLQLEDRVRNTEMESTHILDLLARRLKGV